MCLNIQNVDSFLFKAELKYVYYFILGMVKQVTGGSYKVQYQPEGPEGDTLEVDFTPPFKRVDMFKGLEKELGIKLPSPDQLDSEGRHVDIKRLI